MAQLDFAFWLTIAGTIVFSIWFASMYFGPDRYKYPKADATPDEKRVSVQVLVLGDLGRSPRMTYHALSIANHGGRVDLIGYLGECIYLHSDCGKH
jgi:beta-1,4-mannosyltransferase